jgi:hypothetical protein
MAGWVCRQDGQGLIEVCSNCQGPSGSRVTARGIGIGTGGGKPALGPFQNRRRPGKAEARQISGQHPGFRRPPGMQVLGHRSGFQKLPEAGRLRAGITQGMNRRRGFEPQQRRYSHGGTIRAAGRGVVPKPVMGRPNRHTHPRGTASNPHNTAFSMA